MKIIVLNYETAEIVVADIPESWVEEDFIRDELSMRPKDCHWLIAKELNIRIL